jgi:VCBS repeat-containing protein
MKIKSGILRAVALIAMLGLTTSAWAECNTLKSETQASNVFELSGQGNFTCGDLNMNNPVLNFLPIISGNAINWTSGSEVDAVVVTPSNGNRCVYIYPDQADFGNQLTPGNNKSVSSVLGCADTEPGIIVAVATVSADTGSVTEDDSAPFLMTSGKVTITDPDPLEAFARLQTTNGLYGTFRVTSDDGSWEYLVDNSLAVIQALDTGDTLLPPEDIFTIESFDGTASNTVTVTIKGITDVVVEEEVLPVTTAGLECTGDIKVGGISIFDDPDIAATTVVLAESLDGQTKAACNVTGSGQSYCEDSCVNPSDRGESAACLAASALLGDGQFDLDACKPCDTALDVENPPLHPLDGSEQAGLPMEFCWEKTGSVYEGTGDLSDPVDPPELNGFPRTEGTMLKHTAIRQSETSITWFNYCYKTSIPINGRYYWVTTCR